MKQYLTVLFCGSLLGAVCTAVAGAKLEKYVRYLAALLCILLIVSPFREFELSLPEEDPHSPLPEVSSPATLDDLARKQAEEELCRVLALQLFTGTGITPVKLCIDMDWTSEEPVVLALHLSLDPAEADRAEMISAWAEAAYGVPCYVTEGGDSP